MPSDKKNDSGLFYCGTDVEVRLGNRVAVARWFRSPRLGVVVYIPGLSPLHPQLEYCGVKQWAIQLEDGSLLVMSCDPSSKYGQPAKKIRFVKRGTTVSLDPKELLE